MKGLLIKLMNQELKDFIANANWIFAKTYASTWPHEYILLKDVANKDLFYSLVKLIKKEGYLGKFYSKELTYYDFDNKVYWTMDDTLENTTLINRCDKDSTYEIREKEGRLPI